MPAVSRLLAPRDPSLALRWEGSSRMKSKKGKAAAGCAHPGASPREARGPGRAGLGAKVTWWTFPPRDSRAGAAAVLFVEAVSGTAVAVFPLDTTRGAAVGRRASPRCWHVVKNQRSAPCLCASKFHCLHQHPTLGPAAAWLLALSGGCGVGLGGPRLAFPGPELELPGPRCLCLKVRFRGLHSPVGPGALL